MYLQNRYIPYIPISEYGLNSGSDALRLRSNEELERQNCLCAIGLGSSLKHLRMTLEHILCILQKLNMKSNHR